MLFDGYTGWLIIWILLLLFVPAFLITVIIYKYLIKKKLNTSRLRYLTGVAVFIVNLFICYLIVVFYYQKRMETMRAEIDKVNQEQR